MTKDMTQGKPLQLILLFSVPLMLGSLFQQFYNMADTIIVGRFVGVEALAAVGSVGGLSYLVLGFVNGIACGFAIPLARCFGARDGEGMRRYTANSVWLSLLFGAVLTVATVALTRPILVLTNTPADIIDMADVYIRTIFAGIPFTLLYNVTSAYMRALGDSRRPLYFLIVASVLNIFLDIFFILAFDAGVFGAALATVISQAVAGVWSLLYMVKNFRMLGWSREEGRFSPSHCADLCMILGSAAVAAMTAGGKAGQILSVPLESIGTAMTTYVGQNLGAGSLPRVRQGVRTALGIGCLYSVASFVILHFTDTLLIGMFLDASEDAGGAIMADARAYLFWNSVFYIPLAVLIVYRYSIQGLGFSGLAMFAGVFEMFARGLVGFYLVPVFGYWAGCIASPVAWFAACFFLMPAYHLALRRLSSARDAGPLRMARAKG